MKFEPIFCLENTDLAGIEKKKEQRDVYIHHATLLHFSFILTHVLKQLMDIGKYKTDSLIRQG